MKEQEHESERYWVYDKIPFLCFLYNKWKIERFFIPLRSITNDRFMQLTRLQVIYGRFLTSSLKASLDCHSERSEESPRISVFYQDYSKRNIKFCCLCFSKREFSRKPNVIL